jgi:hypothetical protein
MSDETYHVCHLILLGLGAAATLGAVVVALFKEDIKALWQHPKLRALVVLGPPHCHQAAVVNSATHETGLSYYLRIWIENTGNLRAEKVHVYASRFLRKNAQEDFPPDPRLIPMNLRWSHGQPQSPEIFADGISPNMGKSCDLGHIIDPAFRRKYAPPLAGVPPEEAVMELDVEIQPVSSDLHTMRPGTYRIELKLEAANCTAITQTIELNLTGKWFPDQAKMFDEGVGLKEVL